jgi:hypothetical protein
MGDYPQATHKIVDCHTFKNQVWHRPPCPKGASVENPIS